MNKLYECPECHEFHTAEEWDIYTQRSCCNRQERRRYYSFKANWDTHFRRKTTFKCPSCNKFVFRTNILESSINDDEIVKTRKKV